MDYIRIAESLGFDKSLVVNIYKKISGGYYISLYYSKPPVLYSLDSWPKKYINKKFLTWYESTYDSVIDQITTLFITLDVKIIHQVSASLLSVNEDANVVEKDIDNVFTEIKDFSEKNGIFNYPQRASIPISNEILKEFVRDIINKREREIKENIYSILGEIAYESNYYVKVKEQRNWIRAIGRDNILKALYLENKLKEFLDEEKDKVSYLLASRYLIFDKIVLEKGISNALQDIREVKNEELIRKMEELYSKIDEDISYF